VTRRPFGPDDLVITRAGALFAGRHFPCSVGSGGVRADKCEGDGATPSGVHGFVGLLYRPDRLAPQALPDWAVPIRPRDLWCDDARHEDYNLMVRAPFASSAEALRRPDPLYDIILITDWNWPRATRGAGSAIFVHTWRGPRVPTAGCIGLVRADLLWIARRIRYHSRLVVLSR
jgi:L,D-peptidoglycan transpeptidase YkuD (ErfK/YbiS/YcfS/YnhG family)